MKEAFVVGSVLTLEGNAEKALAKIAGNLTKTDKLLKVLKANFVELGTVLSGVSDSFLKLSGAITDTNAPMRSLNKTFTTFNHRLAAASYRMDTATEKATALKAAMAGVGESVGAANAGMALERGRARGATRGGSLFGFSAPTLAAGAAGYGLFESYKESAKYQQAFAQFKAINLGAQANASINQFATNTHIPGVSPTELMGILRDATVIMKGDYREAEQIAPLLAEMKYANKALGFSVSDEAYMQILRVAEVRGGFKSPAEMAKQANLAEQGLTAYGGTVSPREFYNFMKVGGVAAQTISDETFWLKLSPIIQELGGSRTGNSLMSLYQAISAGKMTTSSALEFQRLGLVKSGYAEYNKIGMIKRIKPGGVVDNAEFLNDPTSWAFNTLFPALQKAGITSQQQTEQELAILFGNRNAANLAAKLYLQEEKILKEFPMASHAMNADQAKALADTTPQGKLAQLDTAAARLGKAIGDLASPTVIGGMNVLINFLNAITNGIKSAEYLTNKVSSKLNSAPNGTLAHAITHSSSTTLADKFRDWLYNSNKTQNLVPQPHHYSQTTLTHTTVVTLHPHTVAKATTTFYNNQLARQQPTGPSSSDNTVTPALPGSRR